MFYQNFKKSRIVYFLLPLLILMLALFSFPSSAFTANNKELKIPAIWTKANGTPGYDNVSNNPGYSEFPQIVFDSSQKPNIVWQDNTSGNVDIFFSKWNGSQWTKADGVTPGYDNVSKTIGGELENQAHYPQIVLDSNSRPNIVWENKTHKPEDYNITCWNIFFSKWNGSQWTKADGITPGYDNIGGGSCPKILLDSSQRPNIVWENGNILFSKWNGSSWTKADGITLGYDNIGGGSYYPQILLDSSQRPNIVWENGSIFFSKWSGSAWTKADGITTGYDNISNNTDGGWSQQIILDSSQRPNILWGGDDIFFSKWNGTKWTGANGITPGYDNISNNSSPSYFPQMVLDSESRPNIVWSNSTSETDVYRTPINFDIFFSKWNGSIWTKADGVTHGYDNVSNDSNESSSPQIVLDSKSRPNIVWIDDIISWDYTLQGDAILCFSKWNNSFWVSTGGIIPILENICDEGIKSVHIGIDNNSQLHLACVKATGKSHDGGPEYDICYIKCSLNPRLSGDSRAETAVEISKAGWDSSDYVVLARGDDFPDALSGAALAKKFEAPLLLTNSQILTQVTEEEIKRLKTKEVFILGTEDAISHQIENDLTQKCSIPNEKIHRIGGVDRYETAAKIAEWIGKPQNKTCFIATGEDYPDALSASSISAIKQMPILLVRGKNGDIPQATKDTLAKLSIENTIITGQPDVVSSSIEDWLKDNKYNPTRLGGDTRYDTCKQVCDYAIANYQITPEVVGFALGENFPDALASGPLAARFNGLVLLTREFVPSSIKDFLTTYKDKITQHFISGGSDVVSDEVALEIREIIE